MRLWPSSPCYHRVIFVFRCVLFSRVCLSICPSVCPSVNNYAKPPKNTKKSWKYSVVNWSYTDPLRTHLFARPGFFLFFQVKKFMWNLINQKTSLFLTGSSAQHSPQYLYIPYPKASNNVVVKNAPTDIKREIMTAKKSLSALYSRRRSHWRCFFR